MGCPGECRPWNSIPVFQEYPYSLIEIIKGSGTGTGHIVQGESCLTPVERLGVLLEWNHCLESPDVELGAWLKWSLFEYSRESLMGIAHGSGCGEPDSHA